VLPGNVADYANGVEVVADLKRDVAGQAEELK
jgi:hypothetical protein